MINSYYQWDYHFWNEIYKGEYNSKKEKHGSGFVEWNLDETGQWRYEEWAKDRIFGIGSKNRNYDLDDKTNPDRKLTNNKITFNGKWENDLLNGKGEFLLNNKLFCEGQFYKGAFQGYAKFKIYFQTISFGIYNNFLKIPGYSNIETEKEYLEKMKINEEMGDFEGEFKNGLVNGKGELKLKSGLSYKGNWLDGYPYGKGFKTYEDGREEFGEFGILDEGTLKLRTDYVKEKNGILIDGDRKYLNGDTESVNKQTIFQQIKSSFNLN